MAEYIERDNVYEVLRSLLNDIYDDTEHSAEFARGFEQALRCAADNVTDIAAADVLPERHGKWGVYQTYLICLGCNFSYEIAGEVYNYCPNCGAKMKLAMREDGNIDG